MRLSGWGRYPVAESELKSPESADEIVALVRSGGPLIARGNGRSYGDPALAPTTLSMLKLDKIISFDEREGLLVCEAGVLLRDILEAFIPRGWFPPVTPGTKFVTVGGMIACDVHGKNHHKDGSFGRHVQWLDLVRSDGSIVRCSPNEELFAATVGGMGLTGVIVRACLRMLPIETAYIKQRCIVAPDLAAVLEAFEATADWSYSVAWIDCLAGGAALGRSVLYLGEHAKVGDLPPARRAEPLRPKRKLKLNVPLELPISAFNTLTIRAFNELYFRRAQFRAPDAILDYDSYFYPLDSILNWNRLYGYRGFVQHQSVLPLSASRQGLTEILQLTSEFKMGSFLAVLKLFGAQDGVLSFPAHGYTLALDFPWSRRTALLLDRIDQIVLRHGGRVYLAKDARVSRAAFERMQPNLESFRRERAASGAGRVFRSVQSERLGL